MEFAHISEVRYAGIQALEVQQSLHNGAAVSPQWCSSLSTMVQQSLHNGPATNSNVVATEVGVQSFSVGRIANVGIAMISSGELATVSVILPQLDLPVMIFTHILTRFATVVPHSHGPTNPGQTRVQPGLTCSHVPTNPG